MSLQILSTVALPLLLILIMFGLGLGLSLTDFRRVWQSPRPILIGLAWQALVLPIVAFFLARLFKLPPEFAIGLVMVAASPPGPTSSLFTKLVYGDVALSVSLTAVATALSALTAPLATGIALHFFAPDSMELTYPYSRIAEVFFLVTLPVLAGMALRHFRAPLALRLDKPIRTLSLVILVVVVISAVAKELQLLIDHIAEVGLSLLILNLCSISFAFLFPRALKQTPAQSRALSFTLSVHNGSLPLYIAISILGSVSIAVPIAGYSLFMYLTATLLALFFRSRKSPELRGVR